MTTLLIADRDPNERTGISWLVSTCAIPYDRVLTAGTVTELLRALEAERPDVICIELDMVPKEDWERLKLLTSLYKPTVVVTTLEATFERALQGIELHAVDLWLKPQSPEHIRRTLTRCCQERMARGTARVEQADSLGSALSYRSLFLPLESPGKGLRLMLLQLEDTDKHGELLNFLETYPFREKPVLLPLSDVIVCIFSEEKDTPLSAGQEIGKRLLMDWEEQHAEPLSLVLYDSTDEMLSLNQKYRYAVEALDIRFFKGYRQISTVQNKVNWAVIDPFLTPAEQRAWVDMLHDGDREQLKQWMYRQFLHKAEPYPEPGLLRIRLTSILAQVRRFMKSQGLDEGALEEKYLRVFDTILYTPVLYRIVQDLLLFIYELLDSVTIHRDEARLDIVEQAIRYLEENYARADLRLEEVARHVDRSPAYFSSLLTQRHGVSFRQLLTTIRLREAERLLLSTRLSVQEVAERTGFVNANYFSKIFKEKSGTTPRSFRNQKKREKS
ncbi:DNA-binding response regulator [Brevibacillus composti]|uniref:DNA-binding response regulator n=1 Tax=Brevibacillus composti TaxID=2796470 RepID=A0A7T5EMX5_9BACL|nr:helix-turn-helix domain-containing protein [Brevibacillus composti]QQE75517.1 DNA-binding response regulator [Brevibacillus composti]QUO42543.1 DNA-binding response regulator [Brevibacillus composti]